MPLMIRANRVKQVPDNEVNPYMANGYKPYEPAAKAQEQATPFTGTEEFQVAVAAEVEKRMEGIPSQADFEAAVATEVERRLAGLQPPVQEPEEPATLQPPDGQGEAPKMGGKGGKGGKASASSGAESGAEK